MDVQSIAFGLIVCLMVGFIAGAFAWDVMVGDRLRRQLEMETMRRVKTQIRMVHPGTPYRPETLTEAQTAATLIALGDNDRWSRKADLREAK